jgi:hypothetical protein
MESSASAHRGSRSDSTVKVVNSFKELVTSVLAVLSTPLTIAVIVVVSLIAFNHYEQWSHRRQPANASELALAKAQSATALDLAILRACQSRRTPLSSCVGETKRELTG